MKKSFILCFTFFSSLFFIACESSEGNDASAAKGKMMIDLNSDVSYASKGSKARAMDLTPYKNVANYTVELKDASGNVLQSKLYSEMELTQEVTPGTYTVRAYYGENVNAGYDKLYMEGAQTITVVKGDNKTVSFACTPANVKVNLKYSDDFYTFYSDCTVGLKTQYLTEAFEMSQADVDKDLFLKAVGNENLSLTFALKDKNGITVTPANFGAQTVTIKPRDFLTITVKPKLIDIEGGKISGITVTIDNGVQEENIDVTLPDEFMPGEDITVNN
ncbi:DUF4493 domain-containing protein [Bacteroides faecichinchillae]|uniref:DUF4493 domain-containing protein n=1 Tax=Bacteroides TaxID=816 RepID=UPI00097F845B|nr:DUF4493 domain-containing protein [Bacteroides bouchesdurhonensis]